MKFKKSQRVSFAFQPKINYKDQIDNKFKFRGNNSGSIRNKNYKLMRIIARN